MKKWSNVPVQKVTEIIEQAGGELEIMKNMLAVKIEESKIRGLNEKLVGLEKLGERMGAEIGLPQEIDPNFDPKEGKLKLWKKIYSANQ